MIDVLRKLKTVQWRALCKNISMLLTDDLRDRLDRLEAQVDNKVSIKRFDYAVMEHDLLYHGENMPSCYKNEITFLRKANRLMCFPYPQLKKLEHVISGWDPDKAMPYVVHKGKRLYFPLTWGRQEAEKAYRYYIETENILGGDYAATAPHQYQTAEFFVKDGDVVLDVGAAEGLFALDVVEKAKRIFVIEPDEKWGVPLHATFEPFADKVTIINKKASGCDGPDSIQIESLLLGTDYNGLFIKLDVEGFEKEIILSSRDVLCQDKDIRLVAATYHGQEDAEVIGRMAKQMGFVTHYSDGYILYLHDKLERPYFRKGLIRAVRATKKKGL